MTPRRHAVLLSFAAVLVVLLALGLRLHQLGSQSLWYDEGTSAGLASRSVATIVRNASNDIHPPLYYLALAWWSKLAGHGEAGLRGLSVFAGVVLVALVLGLGRRLWGWGEGLAAGFLAAVSPFLVWYSQEARMYSLAAALGTALAWVAAELARGPHDIRSPDRSDMKLRRAPEAAAFDGARSPRRRVAMWAAYVALAVAALYTHYFVGASAVVAANLIAGAGVLRARRRDVKVPAGFVVRWIAAQLLALVLFAPWLAAAWRTISDWPALGPPLGTGDLAAKALHTFVLGIHGVPQLGGWALVGGALALAGVVGSLRKGHRWGAAVAASMAAAPLIAMWALSLTRPAWDPKFLIAAAPGFELLMGAGVVVLGRGAARLIDRLAPGTGGSAARTVVIAAATSAAVLLLAFWPRWAALQAGYDEPDYQRDDYRGVAATIEALAGPEDAVIVNAPTQVEIFEYYDRGRHTAYPIPLGRAPDRDVVTRRLTDIATSEGDLYAVLWATDESDPDGVVEGWLNQHRAKAFDRWFGNVRLAMWAAPREPMRNVIFDLLSFGAGEIDLARLSIGPAAPLGPDMVNDLCDQDGAGSDDAAARDTVAAEAQALRLCDPGARLNVEPGGLVTVDAWWAHTGQEPAAADYTVFLHLVDESGQVLAQRDMAPVGGTARTSAWQPVDGLGVEIHGDSRWVEVSADEGDVVHDRMALLVPLDVAPGDYRLRLGLYDPVTGERLHAIPFILEPGVEPPAGDSVDIADVTVLEPAGEAP